MNTPVYLSRPALTSALGSGLQVHADALLTPSENTPLTFSDQWVKGKTHAFGAVKETLMPLPDSIPEAHRSRNNQLILHALSQIDGLIQTAIARYGKERVAVVTGTSTSGADENIPLFQHVVQGGEWTDVPFKQLQHTMASPSEFIAQVYGLDGLRYTVSTACTSGARALISAARLLRAGLCDAVICGGTDTLSPLTINGFASLEVLSDGIAKPFSANRNGINIGLPIMECPEAADAIAAGDEVHVDFDTGVITDKTTGQTFQAEPFPPFIQKIIADGGLMKSLTK